MLKYLVVDLDGTIADCTHRLHLINGDGDKDWLGFYNACKDDAPIQPMINMVRALNERHYSFIVVTGRSELAREQTMEWLSANNLWDYTELLMRPEGDYREDGVVKLELLNNFVAMSLNGNKGAIEFILDDKDSVVNAYRGAGYRVLQVSGNDYTVY